MKTTVSPLERARDIFRQKKLANPSWRVPKTYEEAVSVSGIGPRAIEELVQAGDIAPKKSKGAAAPPVALLLLKAGLKKLNGGSMPESISLNNRGSILHFLHTKDMSIASAIRRFARLPQASPGTLNALGRWLSGKRGESRPTISPMRKAVASPEILFHLAWIPKTKVLSLTGKIAADCSAIIEEVCEARRWRIRELTVRPTHIHLFIRVRRTDSAFHAVEELKALTQEGLRSRNPSITQFAHLWERRYFAAAGGYAHATTELRKFLAAHQKVLPRALKELKAAPVEVSAAA